MKKRFIFLRRGLKRGAVFTIMASLILIIIIWGGNLIKKNDVNQWQSELYKVKSNNLMINSFIKFSSGALYSSSRSALNELSDALYEYSQDYDDDHTFFSSKNDFQDNFVNCLFGGEVTIDNSFSKDCDTNIQLLLNNYTLLVKNNTGLVITYNIDEGSIKLEQLTPFSLLVSMNLSVKAEDFTSEWDLSNIVINTTVPIVGLKDPLIEKFKGAAVITGYSDHVIKKSPVRLKEWNITKVLESINDESYIASNDAPSFLQRFYYNLDASDYGIEFFINSSLVNVNNKLNRSFVDHELLESTESNKYLPRVYYYCQDDSPESVCISNPEDEGFPDPFCVSLEKALRYNISNEYWLSCN